MPVARATPAGLHVGGGSASTAARTSHADQLHGQRQLRIRRRRVQRGTTTLTDFTVSGNAAGCGGGGLENYAYGTKPGGAITLTGCTLTGNSAYFRGGGLYNVAGTATLTGCTVSGNSRQSLLQIRRRRPVRRFGTMTLSDCTISGNSALFTGAAYTT